jgi:hypothetical protein
MAVPKWGQNGSKREGYATIGAITVDECMTVARHSERIQGCPNSRSRPIQDGHAEGSRRPIGLGWVEKSALMNQIW